MVSRIEPVSPPSPPQCARKPGLQDTQLQDPEVIDMIHRQTAGKSIKGQHSSYHVLRALSIANHATNLLVCRADEHASFLRAEAYDFRGLCQQLLRSRKRHLKRRQKAALDSATFEGQVYLVFELGSGQGSALPPVATAKYVSHVVPLEIIKPKPTRILRKYVQGLESATARDVATVFASRIDAVLETSKKLVDTSAALDWSDAAAVEESRATIRSLEEATTDARESLAHDLRLSLQIDSDESTDKESRECLRSFWEWDTADRAYRKFLHDCGYPRPGPEPTSGDDDQDEHKGTVTGVYDEDQSARMKVLRAMQEGCLAQWQVFMLFLDSVFEYRGGIPNDEDGTDEMGYVDTEGGSLWEDAARRAKALKMPTIQEESETEPAENGEEDAVASRKTVKQREKRRRRRARARCGNGDC